MFCLSESPSDTLSSGAPSPDKEWTFVHEGEHDVRCLRNTGGSRFIQIQLYAKSEFSDFSKFLINSFHSSAMLICPLNLKFGLFKRILLGSFFNWAGGACTWDCKSWALTACRGRCSARQWSPSLRWGAPLRTHGACLRCGYGTAATPWTATSLQAPHPVHLRKSKGNYQHQDH